MKMGGSMMPTFGMMGMGRDFYGERLARMGVEGASSGRRAFTDPAVSLGAGLRIDLGSRLDLRPDGRALVVISGGETHTVGVFTVNVGYRF